MGDNAAINNLTSATAYNGSYWQGVNVDDLSTKLVYTGDLGYAKSNWDYGVTLNEDAVKDIVEKITKKRELAKITPD
ncbi:MAG: hypothetical protein UIH41_06850, partial [Treponemataceae bacterium]|nr:hypothetical protein [Treponemataceae bacterium]